MDYITTETSLDSQAPGIRSTMLVYEMSYLHHVNLLFYEAGITLNLIFLSLQLWGLALTLTAGSEPHFMDKFEGLLPPLPVPKLEDTCVK